MMLVCIRDDGMESCGLNVSDSIVDWVQQREKVSFDTWGRTVELRPRIAGTATIRNVKHR